MHFPVEHCRELLERIDEASTPFPSGKVGKLSIVASLRDEPSLLYNLNFIKIVKMLNFFVIRRENSPCAQARYL